ncbi:MAG: type II toxin-antitoxin system VapC family toxin [Thermoanaerobaculales bacterium]|nr:type II toxin-antitoxin system VapC family toxin [Thermoanaerobaculales bacterium]
MSYLLDTCVLSELIKPRPNAAVCQWVAAQKEHRLFLSVITIGELQKGVSKLSPGRRRTKLQRWLEGDLLIRFQGRLLGIDTTVAGEWGVMLGEAESRGRPIPVIDALIAATARVHHCAVVTRNETDIKPTGIDVVNPWTFP